MGVYKHKKIPIPLYHGYLHIHITDDFKDIEKKLDVELDNCELYEGICFHEFKNDSLHVHVGFPLKTYPDVVAHESKHVVNKIFKIAGIKLDVDNDEPECYLLSWVVKQVYDVINRDSKTR